MNIEQLKRLREDIALMHKTLEKDVEGSEDVERAINKLDDVFLQKLKDLVWERYLEAEG